MFRAAVLVGLLAGSADALPLGDDQHQVDPKSAEPGAICHWQSADGLKFEYCLPIGYDPQRGANLTLILHGNGLDETWGFLNHPVGRFRADDILVSPDGTTPVKGTNANEFLGDSKEAERLHALIEELRACWKVRQEFIYGHSQGSFFAFFYAGQYPDEVDGVCGHASGVWNWTSISNKGRRQAIGLMHGTADSNVPYGQSWWGRKAYREQEFPRVHLRTLYDWDHRPSWGQAQLVLAWCEGATTGDPARMEACLATLGRSDVPLGIDWSALWVVADRLAHDKHATDGQRARAAAAGTAVDALAAKHIAAITASLGKGGVSGLKTLGDEPPGRACIGHVPRLLEEFEGVPACEAWRKSAQRILDTLSKKADDCYADYLKESQESPAQAFKAGLELLDEGWTHYDAPKVADQLERWAADPKVEVSKGDAKRLASLIAVFRTGRKDGFAEYTRLNAGIDPLASP